jgi:glycine/D-amino acid oxidase-like deaminating enzyme
MACGAARILADCLLERKPEVPIEALSLARYRAS